MIPTSRWFLYIGLTVAGCAADLFTKTWIFGWGPGPGRRGEWWLVENYVGIQQALNPGALFGMGKGFALVFAALSVVALVGIAVWLFVLQGARDSLLTLALGCVSGGILGNLYDRLGWHGLVDEQGQTLRVVRDWILFCYHDHIWPNFNIADCLLVSGAFLLALQSLKPLPKSDTEAVSGLSDASPAPPAA